MNLGAGMRALAAVVCWGWMLVVGGVLLVARPAPEEAQTIYLIGAAVALVPAAAVWFIVNAFFPRSR